MFLYYFVIGCKIISLKVIEYIGLLKIIIDYYRVLKSLFNVIFNGYFRTIKMLFADSRTQAMN